MAPHKGETRKRHRRWKAKKTGRPINGSPRRNLQEQSKRQEFVNKVHVFHKISKTMHHLSNISKNKIPKPIKRTTQSISLIEPAMQIEYTRDLILGKAKNWETTTMQILMEHCNDVIIQLTTKLQLLREEDWRDAFTVAVRWARRGLGRRLRFESIQKAEEIIQINSLQRSKTNTEIQNTNTGQQQIQPGV